MLAPSKDGLLKPNNIVRTATDGDGDVSFRSKLTTLRYTVGKEGMEGNYKIHSRNNREVSFSLHST